MWGEDESIFFFLGDDGILLLKSVDFNVLLGLFVF